MKRRYAMIGAGPASVSAAQAVRSQDADGDIAIIGAEPYGYYSRPGLAYYLADEVPEQQLFPFGAEDFARINAQVILSRAVRIDPAGHQVMIEEGRTVAYDRLLVATGARATPVNVPGADLDGVVSLDDLEDARRIIRLSRSAKAAVVVGGGITALEIVEGLCARRMKVHYFMRKDRYWSNVLSESESRIVEKGLQARGVEIHHFTELAEIIGGRGRVAAVRTEKGERIPCDMLAVAVGVLPQKELAEAAGLKCARGIVVDEHLHSSDEDIFAAGDVAEVCEPLTDRYTLEILWSSAVAKGRVAGLNMSGDPKSIYEKGVPLNVTRLAGFKISIMGTVGSGKDADLEGIARGDSETWRRLSQAVTVESQAGGDHIRLALGEKTILGAVVMGDQTLSIPLQRLIAAHADVSLIREQLLQPGGSVGDLIQAYWADWRVHHG